MPDLDDRTMDGARDTIALLEALTRNDKAGAEAILNNCDPAPTIFSLAGAWLAAVDYFGGNAEELIESMKRSL